jgi:hypothetical protein
MEAVELLLKASTTPVPVGIAVCLTVSMIAGQVLKPQID